MRGDRVLTFKQQEFARFYTDQNDPKTYLNAVASAVKAGFAKEGVAAKAKSLLNRKGVKEYINSISEEKKLLGAIQLEEKKSIAWENYLTAKASGESAMAQKWFKEHGELAGHYIQRSEVDQKVKVEKVSEEESKMILEEIRKQRNRLSGVLN
jgi:phage terminase small subunit